MVRDPGGTRHRLLTNVPLLAAADQDMGILSSRMTCELGCRISDSVQIVRAFIESSKLRVYIQISRIGRIKRARSAREDSSKYIREVQAPGSGVHIPLLSE